MGFQERLVILFGSIAIGLTISNFTYLWFIRNGISVEEEVFVRGSAISSFMLDSSCSYSCLSFLRLVVPHYTEIDTFRRSTQGTPTPRAYRRSS